MGKATKNVMNSKIIHTLKKNKYVAVVVIICVLLFIGVFLRFYQLGQLPLGLNKDESAIGYNAYSISKTGKDEHGVSWPLYFKSYGDYKMPVYMYGTAAMYSVFGVNEFSIRFLSAFFGCLSLFIIFLFTYELTKKLSYALVSLFLLTFNPWHIFFSHAGFEVNVALSLSLLGAYLLLLARRGKKFRFLLFVSVFFFVIAAYTYNVSRVLSPLIFIGLLFYFFVLRERVHYILVGSLCMIMGIAILPLFSSADYRAGFQNQQIVLINGLEYAASELELRSNISTAPPFITKLFFNHVSLITLQYIKNIFGTLSPDFFFLNGSSHPVNGMGNIGMLYIFELPAVIIGAIIILRKKMKQLYSIFIWLGIVVFVGSLVLTVPNSTRHYFILIPLLLLSTVGISESYEYLKHRKNKIVKGIVSIFAGVAIIYSIVFFLVSYFYSFPLTSAKTWRAVDKKVVQEIINRSPQFNKVIFDDAVDFSYTSFLFYSLFPPEEYHKLAEYKKSGMLITLDHVGKYEFHTVDWDKEYGSGGKKFFVTTPDPLPENKPILEIVKLPSRQIANIENGEIKAYPLEEEIYVLIEAL